MDEVLKLVNRLQSACTLLGDTAGQKDSDLPGLWEMLPSIVVIGGQVYCSCKVNRHGRIFRAPQQLLYKQPSKVNSTGSVCKLVPQDVLVTSSSF